jgi:dTDP-4-amino-4,6-dideoxygalactose transaminase
VTFWFSARVAIFQAIAALGLRAGDAVALPAFCCGSEVEPFIHAGLTPRFFRVTDTLDPDAASFKAALDGSVAALATHYFGFAADLSVARAACRAAGVPLIEDCAHALYSKDSSDWVGAQADVAIFSVVKSLPVPDGGALIMRVPTKATPSPGSAPRRQLIAKRTRSLLIRHFQAHPVRAVSWAAHLPHAAKHRLGLASSGPNRETQAGLAEFAGFDPLLGDTQISPRSMRLLAQTCHGQVKTVRRRNYQRLLEAVRDVPGLRLLFPSIPEGTCPLALPVAAADPVSFRRTLAAAPGVGVTQMWPWFHPSVPWDEFPFETTLKRSTFILPVHQSLHESEIRRIIAAVTKWFRT